MMMKQEMASEMIRSRNQTDKTMAREGVEFPWWSAWDSVTAACSGMIFPILYGLSRKCRDDSPSVRERSPTTTAAGFRLQYCSYAEARAGINFSISDYSDGIGSLGYFPAGGSGSRL